MRDLRCFDPRDPSQSWADRSTWKDSKNPVLQHAAELMAAGYSGASIDWSFVASLAQECDDLLAQALDEAVAMFADIVPHISQPGA